MKKLSLLGLIILSSLASAKEIHNKPIQAKEVKSLNTVTASHTTPSVQMDKNFIEENLNHTLKVLAQLNLINPEVVPVGNTFVSETPHKRDGRLFYLVDDMTELTSFPGYSMSAPTGFAGKFGVAFLGLGGSYGTNSNQKDGSASVGMGWGDAGKYVGGSAVLGLGSIDPRDGGAFSRGNFSFSMGHNFSSIETGVSVGVTGVDLWKATNNTNTDPSVYLAVSKYFHTDWKPMFLTAGVGNNVFASITRADIGHCTDVWGGFASGAIYLHPQLSFIVDYTSDMLSAGFGIVPMPQYPVNLSIGAADLNKQNSNKEISIVGSLSVAYVF